MPLTLTPITKINYKPGRTGRRRKRTEQNPNNNLFYIYKLTSWTTGKSYIGCTKNIADRLLAHAGSAKNKNDKMHKSKIAKAIRKYGLNDFWLEILDSDPDQKFAMNDLERGYIELHNTTGQNGYNEAKGGYGTLGTTRDSMFRQQMSKTSREVRRKYKGIWATNKGMVYWTNGVQNKMIKKHARPPGPGWRRGMTMRRFKKGSVSGG